MEDGGQSKSTRLKRIMIVIVDISRSGDWYTAKKNMMMAMLNQ